MAVKFIEQAFLLYKVEMKGCVHPKKHAVTILGGEELWTFMELQTLFSILGDRNDNQKEKIHRTSRKGKIWGVFGSP